jgi:hypothetical protein
LVFLDGDSGARPAAIPSLVVGAFRIALTAHLRTSQTPPRNNPTELGRMVGERALPGGAAAVLNRTLTTF